jgi:hypothetical protein
MLNHHKCRQIYFNEKSSQFLNHKIATSFKMHSSKLTQIGVILILFVLLTPSSLFSYTVLWDTSHGIANSGQYQPSGYYLALSEHLGDNGFTTVTTSQGFLVDDPVGYDVIVVCLTSAFNSSYTSVEVGRIVDFVNDGGGLLIMGDRLGAPNANIQPVASEFGITLGLSNVVSDRTNIYEVYTSELDLSHPVFSSFDTGDEIFTYAAGELSVTKSALPAAWQEGTGKIIVAVAQYGQGRVVALGDCSLWSLSDSVLNPWDYFHEADNPQFALNTFTYLAVPEPATLLLLGLGTMLLIRRKRS